MKNYIFPIIWAGLIFYLSAGSGINLPESWLDALSPDKIGHLTVYGLLTFLLLWAFYRHQKIIPPRNIAYLMVAISAFYGIALEIMQFYFFPGRYFEYLDIIANIIGSIVGLFLFKYFFTNKP